MHHRVTTKISSKSMETSRQLKYNKPKNPQVWCLLMESKSPRCRAHRSMTQAQMNLRSSSLLEPRYTTQTLMQSQLLMNQDSSLELNSQWVQNSSSTWASWALPLLKASSNLQPFHMSSSSRQSSRMRTRISFRIWSSQTLWCPSTTKPSSYRTKTS